MATTPNYLGSTALLYTGSANADNAVVIQTGDVSKYDVFVLQSTQGPMDVYVSLDGTNYSTAPLSLIDMGATTITTAVLTTAANRTYKFEGCFQKIQVLQNGATAVTGAALLCKTLG